MATSEREKGILKKIRDGQSNWGSEYESDLDGLKSKGLVDIIKKHEENRTGKRGVDTILVRLTDEGRRVANQ